MAKKMKKSVPVWVWAIIGILALTTIILFILNISDKEILYKETKGAANLYDSFQLGDLSFSLYNVQLDFYNRSSFNLPNTRWLFFNFNVLNNGKDVKNFSDCGVLLFEDASQYKVKLSSGYADISEKCNYYQLYPGGQMKMNSYFTFIETLPNSDPYSKEQKDWEEVPGSKITYFSQQEDGLVKFEIDKSEINIYPT